MTPKWSTTIAGATTSFFPPVSGERHRKVTWEALATLMPMLCSVSRKCCSPSGPGVYVIRCVTPLYRTDITLDVGLRVLGVRAGRQSGSTLLQNLQRVSSLGSAIHNQKMATGER
jgi:hypothetical protein